MTTTRTLQLPGNTNIDLILNDEEFVGLGQISIAGVALRNADRPMLVRCDTPDGVLYTRLLLRDVKQNPEGVRVELTAVGTPWGRGEYADEYDQNLMWPTLAHTNVEDRITLVLKPASLEVGGKAWTGFSYAFEYHSDQRRIHRFWTHATWEIGGSITGNTVLNQGQCNMPVYRGVKETQFTTTCLKTLDRYGEPAGVSYQLAPRGGLLQGFDFQHAAQGALLMYWPRFDSVVSVLDSPVGCDVLHMIDEHRFELSGDVSVPTKHVLFCAGPIAEHEARDLWWHAHEHIYGGIRASFNVKPTVVLPEVGLRYSTRVHNGGLKMTVGGQEVDSQQVPYAIADSVLPRLAEQGIRRFFPEVMSESDVTQLGMLRKLDGGVHGDLHCSSVCATHRFRPAEFWGGMKAWRYMADKAKALGIELGAWFAPHFSPRAPIYQEHPEYRVIAANGNHTGGGYGFSTLLVADWSTGIRQWVLDDFKRWKEEGGLEYIFTDSWANLGLVQVNFAQHMRTNLKPLGELYGMFQKMGLTALSFEGISPLGYSRFGVADLRGENAEAAQGIVGQNDFGWWVGEEDMSFALCPMVYGKPRSGENAAKIQFRLLANRSVGCWEHFYDIQNKLPDWWVRLNHIYLQAVPHMKTRKMLADRAGVSWDDGNARIVWAFEEVSVACDAKSTVLELTPTQPKAIAHGSTFKAQPGSVYKIV